jgi:uncharacterized YceG family protein
MTEFGGPPGGRHSSGFPESSLPAGQNVRGNSSGPRGPGFAAPRYEPARYEPPSWTTETAGRPFDAVARTTGSLGHASGLLDRHPDETGPLVEPEWWAYATSDHPGHPMTARHSGEEPSRGGDWGSAPHDDQESRHPSAPLPPMPSGVWDRLHSRRGAPLDDAETVAQPLVPPAPPADDERDVLSSRADEPADDDTEAHLVDPRAWEDQTGGLDVIGAHVAEEPPRRLGRRARREAAEAAEAARRARPDAGEDLEEADAHDLEHDVLDSDGHDPDGLVHDEDFGEYVPVKPYDPRSGRTRRRRRPVAVLVSLLMLAGLIVGIVLGGQKLLTLIDPSSRDYSGQGTGAIDIRVSDGDTLSDIARTLVDAGVVASVGPFVQAAEANADSVGIQPGVYALRKQMSGQAALDLMLDPAARRLSRVTLPEGLTAQRTLARLAEATGRSEAEFQAAAEDTVALGLPAYANGGLEGFLFPATYDVEPDDAPADILREMVARTVHALDELQIPVERRLEIVTKASLVQAEAGSVEDMGKVARVLENRLADGMALQLDTTVNYANNKGGITTSAQDRANPSPYNTYVHPGLPPGAISNPGEDAIRAVMAPTPGDWRFFVVVDPDTGETRFGATAEEHQQNVLLFQQWLRENPEG